MVWDRDVPEKCREVCEARWENAEATQTPRIDLINPDCTHQLEYEDSALRRGIGAERIRTILSVCVETGDDVLNENYTFPCPY